MVIEYVNDYTGHYFLAADSADSNAVESGAAGPGWRRTSNVIGAYIASAPSGLPVYRFYAPGPNSHFYTADPIDLAAVRAPGSGWIEEGVKFRISIPSRFPVTECTTLAPTPVHRLYNNRFIYNDSAHRWVSDDTLRAIMVAKGWIDEDVVFCALAQGPSTVLDAPYFSNSPLMVRSSADCGNEAINLGPCVGMNALPTSFPNRIVSGAPGWTDAYDELTGGGVDVLTAQPIGDVSAVLAHTFLQGILQTSPGARFVGMHIPSLDAQAPLASVDSVYQFTTTPPGAGQPDARVFPWIYPIQSYIDFTFQAYVPTVNRADTGSHAYGNSLIEFKDVTSGQSIDVTVLAYGTMLAGDFVSIPDPSTGNVWVSTTYGASMLFGQSLANSYVQCNSHGFCPLPGDVYPLNGYRMRLSTADFSGIITRARALNPALSTDPRNYVLVKYLVRNGILGNAEMGVTVSGTDLSVYGY